MTAIAFDTLKFARTLQEKGNFSPEQSSSLVEALGDVLAVNPASKADLSETEARLEADLREFRVRLQADLRETELPLETKIAETKADLVKWLFGVVGFQTVIILGAVVALARVIH